MASRVRAGETNVDCSEAAELLRMARDIRMANGPMTGPARTAKMLAWFSGFPAPSPASPTPAKDRVASATVM